MIRAGSIVSSVLLCGVLSACAKLNGAFDPDARATTTETEAGTTSEASDATVGGGPTTANDEASSAPGEDGSRTDEEGGGESGPTSGSTTEPRPIGTSETGEGPTVWDPACESPFNDASCEPQNVLDGDWSCSIPGLYEDGLFECGYPNAFSTEIAVLPGIYVIGALGLPVVDFLLEAEGEPSACEPGVAGLVTDTPLDVVVTLRSDSVAADRLVVRDATALCGVPDDCCEAKRELGGGDACSDDGLVSCVENADSFCTQVWDEQCVRVAVLVCGANCAQILPKER